MVASDELTEPRERRDGATPGPSPLGGSAEAFGRLVDPYRRELLVHGYRMLGSIDDAEDAVQEALVNAWRRRETYVEDRSLRAWLYRIATNACLDAIDRRSRQRGGDVHIGVGPIPDALLDADTVAGPEARFDARESVSLAFLTALQVLPPRQRAVLILRDVLSWRAAEVAALLDVSVPAVNSALQRARETVGRREERGGRSLEVSAAQGRGHLGSLLERYVRAWESADVPGLVALLREDALLSMPPRPSVSGATRIGDFFEASIFVGGRRMRLVPTASNRRPAFLAFARSGENGPWNAFTLLVIEADARSIARIDAFVDPAVLIRFGDSTLDATPDPATSPG
jgi:RNA polymerase sigma-70 factor, ECF subfamily